MAENVNNTPVPEKPKKEPGKIKKFFNKLFSNLEGTTIIGFIVMILAAVFGGIIGHKSGKEDGLAEAREEHVRDFFTDTNKVTRDTPLHLVDDKSNTDVVIVDRRQYEDLDRAAKRNVDKVVRALMDEPVREVEEPTDRQTISDLSPEV